MLFYMNSKVFRDNYLRYESDKTIHDAQYVLASTRIYKTREYKNIVKASSVLFPSSNVFIGDSDGFRDRYFEQLEKNIVFIAYLIKDSIEKKHNIIFICTKKEDKSTYLKYLSEFIYIRFGYPCYEYDNYAKGVTPLIEYSSDEVLKAIRPYIKEGKKNEKAYNMQSKEYRKKYIKKLKHRKSELIKEVKKLGYYSKKWEKELYVNDNIPYIFNTFIYEYDMKEAGFSIIKDYMLLDIDTINKLKAMSKHDRAIKIGKLQRKDKTLSDGLKVGFVDCRQQFITSNNLEDNDIISIKKDALFVKKRCKNCEFLNNILFRVKNTYTSYIRLEKVELYYSPERLDIKGISDDMVELHADGILEFIRKVFRTIETGTEIDVIRYIISFIDKYKAKKLPISYYREFNSRSLYTRIDTDDFYENYIDDIDMLNIRYNYDNIIIPILQIFVR